MSRLWVWFATALAAGGLGTIHAVTPAPAQAAVSGAYGPDTCVRGYVWREATPGDHVCVTPAVRTQARSDNAEAANRRNPGGGAYGPDTCKPGYVWRESTRTDHVCVEPAVRSQAASDNKEITKRWAAIVDPDGGYTPYPFHYTNTAFTIFSTRSGRQDLVVAVEGARQDNGTGTVVWKSQGPGLGQRFKFRFRGGAPVRTNAFEIVDTATGKCLDVAGFSKSNGARVVLWDCTGNPNQMWYFERPAAVFWEAYDEFQIRSMHSDKCLDAANPAQTAPGQGAIVQQWDCLGGHNQRWRPRAGG